MQDNIVSAAISGKAQLVKQKLLEKVDVNTRDDQVWLLRSDLYAVGNAVGPCVVMYILLVSLESRFLGYASYTVTDAGQNSPDWRIRSRSRVHCEDLVGFRS